jgi:hypothetical protein
MEFLNYDNFLVESFTDNIVENSFDNMQILEATKLSSEINDKIKFGIIMATHKVADDPGTRSGREKHKPQLESFKECVEAIKAQKYKNWKLFVCADCYDGDEELVAILKDTLDKKDYWYYNLPNPGERTNKKILDGGHMHKLAGCKAWNTAMEQLKKENFKYGVKLGHDDVWTPDHLETHAKAYTQFPESKVVWTKTSKRRIRGTGLIQWPGSKTRSIDHDSMDFKEGNTADIYSWEVEPFKGLKWRSVDQLTSAPKRKYFIPGDVDMWSRMGEIIKDKEYKTLYVPKITYRYRNNQGKLP